LLLGCPDDHGAHVNLTIDLQPSLGYVNRAAKDFGEAMPAMQAPHQLGHYNFLRKPAADWGWDWGPAFLPGGLGKVCVQMLASPRLQGAFVFTRRPNAQYWCA
jgi:hypothetical protein